MIPAMSLVCTALWHCRLYHDRDFCRQLAGRLGFAEGVTMGHQLLVQLESIPLRLSGPVWWRLLATNWRICGWSACA